ncbi:MAG: helix-turn-helix domain-containing protein [Spirochaetaceae bacterium]|jgi:excisionase family DNA binding protein|nr:helix-turn-helix domain-containing protein [Spirochaetaceae bacterium]
MQLLTIGEAAQVLTVSEVTARRLAKSGALPYRQIGRQIRVTEADIDAFLNRAARNQSAAPVKEPAHD